MKVPVNKLKEEVEMMKRNHKSGIDECSKDIADLKKLNQGILDENYAERI